MVGGRPIRSRVTRRMSVSLDAGGEGISPSRSNRARTKASIEFARTFDSINKIVFSRSLDSAEDSNTRVVRGNLQDEILKLKQESGKNIMAGGVDIPSQLIELGLVDEYRVVVQPIVAGAGRRLLEDVNLPESLHLKLVESKVLKSGCVALRYSK